MAKKVTVPIDMASEQKTILGVLSTRQLIYLAIGGSIIYAYVPIVFGFANHWMIGAIIALISALPTAAVSLLLAFGRKQKYDMFYDQFLLVKFKYNTQRGIWRKGE